MSEDFMCITSIRNCLCCDKEMKGDDDFCVDCEKDDLERQLAEAREENKILQHHMQCIARTKPNLVNPIKPYDLVERAINALHQAEQLKEQGGEI